MTTRQLNNEMKIIGLILVSIVFVLPIDGQTTPLSLGSAFQFNSTVLQEQRTIFIYTPPGFDTIQTQLPVLYIMDGEYRFLPTVGIYHYQTYWKGLPDAVLVGIANVSRSTRIRDYTPVTYGGQADHFIEFMEKELIPMVEAKYNTSDRRYVIGHSHGGVLAFYSFLKRPDLFKGYICSDPSLVNLESYLDEHLKNKYQPARLFLSSSNVGPGMDEEIIRSHLGAIEKAKSKLEHKKPEGLEFKYIHVPDDHANSYVQACSEGLRFMFKPIN